LRTQFAPGQFVTPRSDDEALAAPAFLPLKAGVDLRPAPAAGAEERPVDLDWDEHLIARDIPMPRRMSAGPFIVGLNKHLLDLLGTAMSTRENGWWVVPKEVITVNAVAPVAAAFSWSMAADPGRTATTGLEMAQAVHAVADVMTVEAWELNR
jgi:hypothetical protein